MQSPENNVEISGNGDVRDVVSDESGSDAHHVYQASSHESGEQQHGDY